MNPQELVRTASPVIGSLGAAFYFHPDTLARGKELNLDGFRFYVLGRGGVLGDVESRVVTSAFGYFNPAMIDRIWNSAKERQAPRDAAREYLECARNLGRKSFSDLDGLDAFCQAAEAINAAANPAALALYAGISAEPLPSDLPGRAMQLVAVLRELRGSIHLLSVVASGLEPRVAHLLRRPDDYGTFGWGEDKPTVGEGEQAKLDRADALTDELLLESYSAVDASSADAMVRVLETMQQRLGG